MRQARLATRKVALLDKLGDRQASGGIGMALVNLGAALGDLFGEANLHLRLQGISSCLFKPFG